MGQRFFRKPLAPWVDPCMEIVTAGVTQSRAQGSGTSEATPSNQREAWSRECTKSSCYPSYIGSGERGVCPVLSNCHRAVTSWRDLLQYWAYTREAAIRVVISTSGRVPAAYG